MESHLHLHIKKNIIGTNCSAKPCLLCGKIKPGREFATVMVHGVVKIYRSRLKITVSSLLFKRVFMES